MPYTSDQYADAQQVLDLVTGLTSVMTVQNSPSSVNPSRANGWYHPGYGLYISAELDSSGDYLRLGRDLGLDQRVRSLLKRTPIHLGSTQKYLHGVSREGAVVTLEQGAIKVEREWHSDFMAVYSGKDLLRPPPPLPEDAVNGTSPQEVQWTEPWSIARLIFCREWAESLRAGGPLKAVEVDF